MNDNRGLKHSDIFVQVAREFICLPYNTVKSVIGAAYSSSIFLYAMFRNGKVADCGKKYYMHS